MNKELEKTKKQICKKVVEELDFSEEQTEEDIFKAIDNVIISLPKKEAFPLKEKLLLRQSAFNSLKRYDIIQEFLEDEEVTEIMINGVKDIFVEKNGKVSKVDRMFESREKLEDIIQQIVASCNRTVNEASPIQDARLPMGERVNIVLAPVALNGPIVTIRRFPRNPITMEKLIDIGSITDEAASFLKELVRAKYNIFISGGTGTGKTTFLNALSQYIPKDERIITIEDSAELQLLDAENIVKLETRNKAGDGCEPISIKDLIKTALRMRPDRIVVGEVRGAECADMLAAMNTGHDGSLSTGHANSTKDMISRLETMVLSAMEIPLIAIRNQIASGIDIMIHLGRLRDHRRVVLSISELSDVCDGEVVVHKIFEWNGNTLAKVSELQNNYKLNDLRAFDGL